MAREIGGPVTLLRSITLVILLTMILFTAQVQSQGYIKKHTKGYCTWYGQCTSGNKAKNCLYNGPAKKLNNSEGLRLVNSICPELRGQHTCCDTKQLQALGENLETMRQLSSRCPACWNNMRRLYCEMTCDRDQSLFLDPSIVLNITNHLTIFSVNYYVSERFKQGLYNSCKDVTFPGNNEKILNLLCGRPAENCNAQDLLDYMGSTLNGFTPFTISFPTKLAQNLHWMDKKIFPCNESFIDPQSNRTAMPCSCQDCAPSCPVHPTSPPPKPKPCRIFGLDVFSYTLLVSYLTFLVVFIPSCIIYALRKRKQRYTLVRDSSKGPPFSDSLPLSQDSHPRGCKHQIVDKKLRSTSCYWFTRWGMWCCTYPGYSVVGSCFLIVTALVSCLVFFSVTTSGALHKREIYDSNFSPSYRTEQLVIHPTNFVPPGYKRYPDGRWIPFGPIFHLHLLRQALDLQNEITNMKVPFGSGHITLEDICFQPLAPQKQQCMIESFFQYFQNNRTKLNKCLTSMGVICNNESLSIDFKAYDFHSHTLVCTSSPFFYDGSLEVPCLSAYGAPIAPKVTLGGFSGIAYQNATTLIINFVVNGSKLLETLVWEQAFTKFMKDYVNDPKNANLTISFSAA